MTYSGLKNQIKLAILFIVFLALFQSCTKQDRDTQIASQIKEIDAYATNSAKTGKRVVVYKGSTRLVIAEGSGDSLMVGDSVFFDFAGYIFSSGIGTLFETNIESVAEEKGVNIYNRGFDYGAGVVGNGKFISGLDRGLLGSKVGEHSYIVFPADLGFYNKEMGLVPKMSPLIYEVWIKEIKKN